VTIRDVSCWNVAAAPGTMVSMTSLRWLLTLVLTVALDLSSPMLFPPVPADAAEEVEVGHARSGQRRVRLVQPNAASVVAPGAQAVELSRTGSPRSAPPRQVTRVALIPKRPPSSAESASAPEDH
jgi:hypothetical protein